MELKADEMFEKLGYKKKFHVDKKQEVITIIGYTKGSEEAEESDITFLILPKIVSINIACDMEELCAIYKKCEELGWIITEKKVYIDETIPGYELFSDEFKNKKEE